MTLVEKRVRFDPHEADQVYHCLTQADYVGVIALTRDGLIPIVRQYRPAVETYTWEFPAGTVDPGETPEESARREVREEAGLDVESMMNLGSFFADTGRLQVTSHAFFARSVRSAAEPAEAGIQVKFVTPSELRQMIRSTEFGHQLHLAIYAAALIHDVAAELRI